MNKNIIKEIIYILIAVLLGIFAVKFVIWLLPVILIGIVAYMIYKSIKKNKVNVEVNKNNKKRPMKVIHDLEDDDK